MCRTKTFTFFTDPGHGWLAVSLQDCADIGLSLRDFTHYSYRHIENLYLEEDCDAGLFINAFTSKYGHAPTIEEIHSNRDSLVRKFRRICHA
jgi:hypothetical protein